MKDLSKFSVVILDWHEQLNDRPWIFKFEDIHEALTQFTNGSGDTSFDVVERNDLDEFLEIQNKIHTLEGDVNTDYIYNKAWHEIDNDPIFKKAFTALELFNEITAYQPGWKMDLRNKLERRVNDILKESFCSPEEVQEWLEEDEEDNE